MLVPWQEPDSGVAVTVKVYGDPALLIAEVVFTASVEALLPEPLVFVNELGLKLPEAPLGNPETLRSTVHEVVLLPVNETAIGKVADWPAGTGFGAFCVPTVTLLGFESENTVCAWRPETDPVAVRKNPVLRSKLSGANWLFEKVPS